MEITTTSRTFTIQLTEEELLRLAVLSFRSEIGNAEHERFHREVSRAVPDLDDAIERIGMSSQWR